MHNVRGDYRIQVHTEIKLSLVDVKESKQIVILFEIRLNSELWYINIRSSLSLSEEKYVFG